MKSYQQPAAGFESPDQRPASGPTLVPPWSLRLIQIQARLLYLSTLLSKMDFAGSNDWLTGEAMYWVLNDVTLMRWPYAAFPVPMWVCRLLSWGTIAFEVAFPFLVWWPRLRPWLLGVGVIFHVGIWAMMEIGWFGPYMLCYYPVFLSGSAAAWVRSMASGRRMQPRRTSSFTTRFARSAAGHGFFWSSSMWRSDCEFRDIHDREQMARKRPASVIVERYRK